jgi:hypothetical protein
LRNAFKRREPMKTIRDVIGMSRNSEILETVPDRLANVIAKYNDLEIDPHFRHDVYNVLNGAVDIAEALVDPTFPVEHAGEQISRMLEVLSRANRYLQTRPSKMGFSVLIPDADPPQLSGHFTTRQEAESYMDTICALGGSKNCMVVPVKILSQHAVQPKPITRNITPPSPSPSIMHGPIPSGIRPKVETPTRLPGEAPDLDFNPEVSPPESEPKLPLPATPALDIPMVKATPDKNPPFTLPTIEERMKALEAEPLIKDRPQNGKPASTATTPTTSPNKGN